PRAVRAAGPGAAGSAGVSVRRRAGPVIAADRLPIPRTLSPARRRKDRAFTVVLWACGVLAMLPLLFIVAFVVGKGWSALNTAFFTSTPTYPGDPNNGISQAFVGSGIIVGLAALFSIPLGVLSAVYLSEYGHG